MSKFEKSSVKIPSVHTGWDLDAWCYIPSGSPSKSCPVIVMAHGLSANKLMGLGPYADAFASLGYACVVFDYRHWGASDGTPRSIISVADQLEDYRTVIKWARLQERFDPHRVVLWGTSFSGGHVVSLSAETSINPVATIAQCPYVGVSPASSLSMATLKTLFYAVSDFVKQYLGFEPVYIPAAAAPGEVGGLTAEGAEAGLEILAPDRKDYPNEINASAIFEVIAYKAMNSAAKITSPILIVAPEADNLCTLWGAVKVADTAQKGEIFKVAGAGHFEVYPNAPHFEESLSSQLNFLKRVVPV